MKETTLCYIENDGCYLMMLRNKKKNDPNQNKWIGIGGEIQKLHQKRNRRRNRTLYRRYCVQGQSIFFV